MELTPDDVEEIVAILDSTAHTELRLKTRAFELRLRREPGGWSQEMQTFGAAPEAARAPAVVAEAEVEGLATIRAPMVGTFYRAPKPGAAPFVETGAAVGVETVVGIVETMKLMNSVAAGVAGEVVEILVGNGDAVEAGQALMRVRA